MTRGIARPRYRKHHLKCFWIRLEPAAALALGMRGDERPLPHRAALATTAGIALDRIRCLLVLAP